MFAKYPERNLFKSIFIDKNHSDIIKRLQSTLKRFKVNFTKHVNNVNSYFNSLMLMKAIFLFTKKYAH